MAMTTAKAKRTIDSHHVDYDSRLPTWTKNRAICDGEEAVKRYDAIVDALAFTNILIPFSTEMKQDQYDFYKAEAELPGIVSQFIKMLIGGVLRKNPSLQLPAGVPEEATDWLINQFGVDGSSMAGFLSECLREELPTSRAWVYVSRPLMLNSENMSVEEQRKVRPFPALWKAEDIIDWKEGVDIDGNKVLTKIVYQTTKEIPGEDEFNPDYLELRILHELDDAGLYRIRVFKKGSKDTQFTETDAPSQVIVNGQRLPFIPAWPLNGSIQVAPILLSSFISKEKALYNKISRRNHLLYGAATYTPYIKSDMSQDEFETVVAGGLGTWLRLKSNEEAGVLATPTEALQDMEKAIASALDEMARLGIRMLTPETSQSGVALEIRNASQVSQLSFLSLIVTNTLKQVIAFMVHWRYGIEIPPQDVKLELAIDFSKNTLSQEWMRLITEWYESKLIPRSLWLALNKANDIIPSDYDDDAGKIEMTDDRTLSDADEGSLADKVKQLNKR